MKYFENIKFRKKLLMKTDKQNIICIKNKDIKVIKQ